MIKSYMLLRNAFKVYCVRWRYAYFYGAKNELLTEQRMNELINIYWTEHFNRYSENELKEIKDFSRNKIGLDCSGFITLISNISGSSAMLFEACPYKTSVSNGKAGSLLYKKSHCGIDIGYGYCMHMPIENHTIEIAKIQDIGFTDSGELPDYDYSEANNY